MTDLLRPARPFFLAVFAVTILVFAAVLTGQYAFGLVPCELCLMERVPYGVAGLIALAMSGLPTSPRLRRLAAGLITLTFACGVAIAFYHVGVEQHWWASAVCTGPADLKVSFADLQAALTHPAPRPSCDQVQWSLFGITLAGYDALLALVLTVVSAVTVSRRSR